jgi:hypothetical protein
MSLYLCLCLPLANHERKSACLTTVLAYQSDILDECFVCCMENSRNVTVL